MSRIIFALLAATIVIGMGLSQSVRAGDVVLTTVERTFIYADGTRETVTQSFKHGGDTKLPRSGTPIADMGGVGTDDGSGESVIPTPSSPNTDINAANSSEFLSHVTEVYTRNNYNGRNYRRTVDWDRDFVGPSWGPWRITRNNFEEFGFNIMVP